MIITLAGCVLVLLYFSVEMIRIKWLRHTTHILMLFGGLVAAFNFGFRGGDVTARGYDSREVQDVIEIVQESSKTNSIGELQTKLEALKVEIPNVIIQNDRLPLLKALKIPY